MAAKSFFEQKLYLQALKTEYDTLVFLFENYEYLKNDFNSYIGSKRKFISNDILFCVNTVDLESINNMDSTTALKYLKSYKGIGTKVASCILLFAYQRFDVFPIDTWVKKHMNETNEKKIKEYTSKKYKEYSGLVIQYMFNYERNANEQRRIKK